jgi:hypothetical protein
LRLEIGADELIQLVTFGPVRSDHDCAVGTLGVSQSDSGEAVIGIGILVDGGLGTGTLLTSAFGWRKSTAAVLLISVARRVPSASASFV